MPRHPASTSRTRTVFLALGLGFALSALPSSLTAEDPPRLAILVQTDSRGELRPCHCPGKTINSLGRRNGVFGMARAFRYPVTVLDGGDFIPDPDDTLHNELRDLMIEAMAWMHYDAVALGERDLFPGPEYLPRIAAAVPLVCANLQIESSLGVEIPAVRWLQIEGSRVALTAYLDPLLFYSAPDAFALYGETLILLDPVESLTRLMKEIRAEADLVILLAHAPMDELSSLLEQVPGFDVVVQGHEPQDSHPGMPFGESLLMVPEPRSREVSQLTITLTKPVKKELARTWDLKVTRYEDKRLDTLVRQFEDRHEQP